MNLSWSYLSSIMKSFRSIVVLDLPASHAHPVIAGAAIHRAIILGQEWHLRFYSALGTNHRVHLALPTLGASTCSTRRIAARCATRWATPGLIEQPFLLVKLLLSGGEYEVISAFATLQGFVFKHTNQGPPCDMMVFFRVHILAESPVCSHP